MSNRIEISVAGLAALNARLALLLGALNTRDILDESGAVLFNRMRTRFMTQTDPDGVPWVVSKASLRRLNGGKTLYDTGRLFRSLQLSADGPTSSSIGTDVPYAPYLQMGSETMPARVFLGFGDEDLSVTEALILKRIERALE
jgi:phage gpG-like protein